MNIGEAFRFIEYLSNKTGNGGYIKPSDRTMLAQNAETEFVSTYYNNVKQYARGDKTPVYGYADSQRINDNLAPYMKSTTLAFTNGIAQKPVDFLHPTGFFATYQHATVKANESLDCGEQTVTTTTTDKVVVVDILLPDTFGIRLSSATTPPTLKYPIAKFEGDKIIVAPANTYQPVLHYIRKPLGSVYAFTGNENDFEFDPINSRDWEAPMDCHIELCNTILGYLGIKTRDSILMEYNNYIAQKGT